ncbi:hypothetical protein dsx2_1784 [Desulfovibrio sp. X2]|uniref:hypothetical protein n=1 Tax=Desulfovibrio sp. X2 TaxID=941449 RepID=UPI0003586D2C|nr:hypothetical protein [Desulfovibrio sp. X2]EPR44423.1 hypothetical protein dsx2_1784 [Desulfovibrio sp. X2]
MAEARKTFPMSTFAAYLKGAGKEGQKQNITELLSFMTGSAIDAEGEPFAAALAKAWIYEQHPELAKMAAGQVGGLGDNVSVVELPEGVKSDVAAIFAKLGEYRKTIADQKTRVAELEKKLAETEGKLAETSKAMADYKGKYEALEASGKGEGEKVIVAAEEKVTGLNTQLGDLAGEIEKVKSSIIAILKAAPAGGAAGGAAASETAGAGAPEVGGAPADTFGFGSDPFSDNEW